MGSDKKVDVLRAYFGPIRLYDGKVSIPNKIGFSATQRTAIYAWVGPEGRPPPSNVVVIPQLRNLDKMSGSCMISVRAHVGLTEEGVPALRAAYIYRWGPDLVVGSLYYTTRYSGLEVYECVSV